MNLKKIIASAIITTGILVTVPQLQTAVYAETSLESERSEVREALSEKETELATLQQEIVELEEQIERMTETIEANEATIKETEDDIQAKTDEIKTLEVEINELEEDIAKRREILKNRAVALQKSGGTISYIEVLFGAENFLDFIDRVGMINKITKSDQKLMNEIAEAQALLESKKATVEDTLTTLKDTKEELVLMQAQIKSQVEDHEANMASLNERKAKSQAMVSELQLEDQQLQQMIENARARVEADRAATQSEAAESITQYAQSSTSKSSSTTAQAATGGVGNVTTVGNRYIGNSTYVFGGGRSQYDVANGRFDCSGFVSWAFRTQGIHISASTAGLSSTGSRVSTANMQPGDLVFFNTYKTNGHVGIYLGNGKFIGSQSSTGVAIADMTSGYWASKFAGHVRRVQ